MERELLGEVTCPSGKLLVIDMGMLGIWTHAEPPLLPEWAAPPETVERANACLDYWVEGADATAATAIFGRTPGWLFDRPADFAATFQSALAEQGLSALLSPRPSRIPHRQRADIAVGNDRGYGVTEFHGMWASSIARLPTEATMKVYGARLQDGDNAGRWRHIELELGGGPVVEAKPVGEVMVDWARLAFVDADALSAWQHDVPIDGKADFVFWVSMHPKPHRPARPKRSATMSTAGSIFLSTTWSS